MHLNLDMKKSATRLQLVRVSVTGFAETSTVYLLSTVQIPHNSTDGCVSVRDNLKFLELEQNDLDVNQNTEN